MDEEKINNNEEERTDCANSADCAQGTGCADGNDRVSEPGGESADAKETKESKKCKKSDVKLKTALAQAEAELKKAKEQLAEAEESRLRLAAEYDNFRRRSKEERDTMYAEAVSESVRELLPIIDNLKLTTVYDDPEKIAEGVKLILKTVPQALEKLGIEEFGAVGEQFDPTLHNAVMHEESDEFGENEISAVLQCGYRRGDKILRFAMVKVAN